MNIEAYDIDSLRKLVRSLQNENTVLKRLLLRLQQKLRQRQLLRRQEQRLHRELARQSAWQPDMLQVCP